MQELLLGFAIIAVYFICAALLAILARFLIKIPDEVFRKILHLILLFSLSVWLAVFERWWIAVIAALSFAIIVFPILILFEKRKNYSKIVTERKKGELKNSLLVVFGMFSLIMSVCWGIFEEKLLVLVCVYSWGFGDAAAALIGKRFGKHKVHWKIADNKKSFEGTLAMFITALITALVILLIRGNLVFAGYVIIPIATSLTCSFVELCTKSGFDTLTCPVSAMVILLPLVHLFGV